MSAEYQYDVAFSFTADDEAIAVKLNDLLSDRLSTFIYSRRQEDLAGTDGEETFNRVFGSASRIVVILYRSSWGETRWTRVEQTAIRNRAFDQGFDFTIFIPLDHSPLPAWVPKTRIWANLERWGFEGAASVIEARVQEAGGNPRNETLQDRAARVDRQVAFRHYRDEFLRSEAGVQAARRSVDTLFEGLKNRAATLSRNTTTFKVEFERAPQDDVAVVRIPGHSVMVAWRYSYRNSLNGSLLKVLVFKGSYFLQGLNFDSSTREQEQSYEFDLEVENRFGWRRKGDTRILSTDALAENCMEILLERVRRG